VGVCGGLSGVGVADCWSVSGGVVSKVGSGKRAVGWVKFLQCLQTGQ